MFLMFLTLAVVAVELYSASLDLVVELHNGGVDCALHHKALDQHLLRLAETVDAPRLRE